MLFFFSWFYYASESAMFHVWCYQQILDLHFVWKIHEQWIIAINLQLIKYLFYSFENVLPVFTLPSFFSTNIEFQFPNCRFLQSQIKIVFEERNQKSNNVGGGGVFTKYDFCYKFSFSNWTILQASSQDIL